MNATNHKKFTLRTVGGRDAIIISFCFPSQNDGPGNFIVKGRDGL
jgi:hypothetical protein